MEKNLNTKPIVSQHGRSRLTLDEHRWKMNFNIVELDLKWNIDIDI